jgi:hypothetical protein
MITTCACCGQEFESKRADKMLCSAECRLKRHRERNRARSAANSAAGRQLNEIGRKLRKEWRNP